MTDAISPRGEVSLLSWSGKWLKEEDQVQDPSQVAPAWSLQVQGSDRSVPPRPHQCNYTVQTQQTTVHRESLSPPESGPHPCSRGNPLTPGSLDSCHPLPDIPWVQGGNMGTFCRKMTLQCRIHQLGPTARRLSCRCHRMHPHGSSHTMRPPTWS